MFSIALISICLIIRQRIKIRTLHRAWNEYFQKYFSIITFNTFICSSNFNNNLRTLVKIQKLSHDKGFAHYHEIEHYLNRGRNQISTILKKLENDLLITGDKNHRPQRIFLTLLGKQVIEAILKELLEAKKREREPSHLLDIKVNLWLR